MGPLFDIDKSITSFQVDKGFVNVGKGAQNLWPRDLNNFAPRLGFAYNVAPKTVIQWQG